MGMVGEYSRNVRRRYNLERPDSVSPFVWRADTLLEGFITDVRSENLEYTGPCFSIVEVVRVRGHSRYYREIASFCRQMIERESFCQFSSDFTSPLSIFLCVDSREITRLLLSAPGGIRVTVYDDRLFDRLCKYISNGISLVNSSKILEFFGFNYGDISVGESNRVSKWDRDHHTYRIWFKRFFGHLLHFTGGICLGILLFLIFFMLSWPLFFDWEMLL